jgi:putative oxidoreductase
MLIADRGIKRISPFLINLGRIALASLFMLGGLNKLFNYSATLQTMREQELAFAAFLLPFVIGLELCGGALLVLGRWLVPITALALAGFTLATNFVFHDFWTMEGERATLELSLFFKNISIVGGLMLLASMSVKN